MLECQMMADGISIVDPGGKSITSPRSQIISWPSSCGLNWPSAVIEHHPNDKLPWSVCEQVMVCGLRLTVVAGHGPLAKLHLREGLDEKSFPSSTV